MVDWLQVLTCVDLSCGFPRIPRPHEKVPSYLQKTCVETFRIINAGLGPNVCVGVLVGEQFEFLEGYTEFLVYV